MPSWELHNGGIIEIVRDDLTRARVDAIVNAANPTLLGGGGVDGAIHRAAGPRLLQACRALPEVQPGVRCPVGEARITPGFDLPARYVIHTVGPIYRRSSAPAAELARAHASSLYLAQAHGLRSVAFPAISCGAYGYPLEQAAEIAIDAAIEHCVDGQTVRFVLLTLDLFDIWMRAGSDSLGTAIDAL